ncbi:MAG: 5'/3'-nucleotidase SurE [Pseudomonadota bacterium]
MDILLSNDDGYRAQGLRTLANALQPEHNITIVAPDRNRSAASNSLTLDVPLRVQRDEDQSMCVNGTPTDCVHLAITGLLESDPDIVISGINHGENLGDDVLYSGTVAAAMEGRFLGLPAMAVSLVGGRRDYFETAAYVVRDLMGNIQTHELDPNTVLNINVPAVDYKDIKGFMATRLGYRHRAEPVIKQHDPRNRPIYWVGEAGPGQDAGEGTDFFAVENGYVSVTPLQTDLTRHESLPRLKAWLP